MAGISRSSTIVISYLMKEQKYTFIDSFDFVRQRRNIIYPNNGFLKQLLEFEKNIHGKNSITYREMIVNRVFEHYYSHFEKDDIEKIFIELGEDYNELIRHLGKIKYERSITQMKK